MFTKIMNGVLNMGDGVPRNLTEKEKELLQILKESNNPQKLITYLLYSYDQTQNEPPGASYLVQHPKAS